MKPSEKKQQTVNELIQLCQDMDPDLLYCWPRRRIVRNWIAETASVLKNLDEGDSQKFVQLSGVISPTEEREVRKKAAYEIDSFIRNKTAEYKKTDFSYMDKEVSNKPSTKKKFPSWIDKYIKEIVVGIIVTVVGGLLLAFIL